MLWSATIHVKSRFFALYALIFFLLRVKNVHGEISTTIGYSKESLLYSLNYSGKTWSESDIELRLNSSVSLQGVEKFSISWNKEGFYGIIGEGNLSPWNALRKTPYGKTLISPGTPWSPIGEAMIVGFGSPCVRFYAMAEKSEKNEGLSDIKSSARHAGFEIHETYKAADKAVIKGSIAATIGEVPEIAAGTGWKAGAAGYPSNTMIGISAFGSVEIEDTVLGAWASISAHSLRPLSAAGSLQWKIDARPWLMDIDAFFYIADEAFRNIEGSIPLFDRILELEIQGRIDAMSFTVATTSQSVSGITTMLSGPDMIRPDSSTLDSLLWQWKTDIVKLDFSLKWRIVSVHSKIVADTWGLRSGTLFLNLSEPSSLQKGNKLSLVLSTNFSRIEAEEYFEDTSAEQSVGRAYGSIRFQGLTVRASCGWKPEKNHFVPAFLGSGDAIMTIRVLREEESLSFLLSFALHQTIQIIPSLRFSFSVSAPDNGYRLDGQKFIFPDISLRVTTIAFLD